MTQVPPVDQRIVDEYFQLDGNRQTKAIAWLYGMVATYGLKPDELNGFSWGPDNSILVTTKKRPVRPLHPQWVFLFSLKEKQPQDPWSCWSSLCSTLYRAIAYQQISVNITDLLLAHRIRKSFCRQFKQQRLASHAYAGAS